MKVLKTRDSAAAVLRKIGINSRDYNLFIKKTANGHEVDDGAARKHVAGEVIVDLVKTKDVVLKPAEPAAPAKALPVKKPKRRTITSEIEGLILAGKTNKEVWDAVQPLFRLTDSKKWYPAWFRSRMRRDGRLPKKEAKK